MCVSDSVCLSVHQQASAFSCSQDHIFITLSASSSLLSRLVYNADEAYLSLYILHVSTAPLTGEGELTYYSSEPTQKEPSRVCVCCRCTGSTNVRSRQGDSSETHLAVYKGLQIVLLSSPVHFCSGCCVAGLRLSPEPRKHLLTGFACPFNGVVTFACTRSRPPLFCR